MPATIHFADAGTIFRHVPGVALCGAVTAVAFALQQLEQVLVGRAWLEALVVAIVVGTVVRSIWTPDQRWFPGISFSAKVLFKWAHWSSWSGY